MTRLTRPATLRPLDVFAHLQSARAVNTRRIETTLKTAALKLKHGNDVQKAFGEQIHDIALDLEKERTAAAKPPGGNGHNTRKGEP